MAKAKSISAANLSKLTLAAVRAVTKGVPGKFTGKGPTMGFILQQDLVAMGGAARPLELAKSITNELAIGARAAGIAGFKANPVVVLKPGVITVGFIAQELNIQVR